MRFVSGQTSQLFPPPGLREQKLNSFKFYNDVVTTQLTIWLFVFIEIPLGIGLAFDLDRALGSYFVTEGGVTRRVARAMEVVQASGPGTRVRLMRAAWHASSGPGTGSSYMLHSSRRVISSGSNHLMSPSLVSKPLEISSTPLDISPEGCSEAASYKVTEPDDHDISEPSKWRGSTRGSSIRMPSEESSSTDNASIIDLDSKLSSLHSTRKLSLDSDNSDLCSTKKRMSSASPILDAPVSLSTLKFKSLLNNTSESWHDRRKSYSFENTSLNERELSKNETAMESSTDSGIHKSSEIVNENLEEDKYQKQPEYRTSHTPREETFKDWLARNRPKQIFKGIELKPHREDKSPERVNVPIAVQSKGKVSINLPNTNDLQDDCCHLRGYSSDDTDKKIKKVEFCKTELHFAAESGKVNIIATDEKPPPTNDFRRRKSAFVPLQGSFEKPVTLFGEKYDSFAPIDAPIPMNASVDNIFKKEIDDYETNCIEENIAVTKSILKNKIPKPKPYFLGENLVKEMKSWTEEKSMRTFNATTLVDKELQVQQRLNSTKLNDFRTDPKPKNNYVDNDDDFSTRMLKKSSPSHEIATENNDDNRTEYYDDVTMDSKTIKQKLKVLQASPVMQPKAKTRQLRDSELTYFGINNTKQKITSYNSDKDSSDIEFNSVRLIQKAASDLSDNASVRSYDTPEYQNLPLHSNYAPVPKPRSHGRNDAISRYQEQKFSSIDNNGFENELEDIHESTIENTLKSVSARTARETSRRKIKNNDPEKSVTKSRSISEPPKYRNELIKELRHIQQNRQSDSVKRQNASRTPSMEKSNNSREKQAKSRPTCTGIKTDSPIYENIDIAYKNRLSEKEHLPKAVVEDNSGKKKMHMQNVKHHVTNHEKIKSENGNKKSNKIHHTNSFIKADKNKNNKTERNEEIKVSTTLASPHASVINNYESLKDKSLNKRHIRDQSPNKYQKSIIDSVSRKSNVSTDRDQLINKYSHQNKDHVSKKKETDGKNKERNEEHLNITVTDEDTIDPKGTQKSKSQEITDLKHRNKKDEKRILKNDTTLDTSNIRSSSRDRRKKNEINPHNTKRTSSSDKREYVINYDDKNGTFSSISKIKHGSSKNNESRTVDNRKVDKESNKENKNRTKLRIPLRK
ncbi:hypothetical protein EVAR_54635_1 [Eumeta japonica]|uniref:Uncharacterized protein n=1 Tax=Eumeta variegata TaxID=151549 RepID=A0A4C1X826_EUMVA|nr:hypothetical protein EVAR_54635_1 [Eumeta japonica]